ncbi:MAG: TetR family transcriptional regulator [Amycolatopsis sp.]|jgi:TetR/AcrR family transcriptional repressor of mexJK operon|uniref:TetR/AcrR family transcriptional regulator n=1 Tax=Amycolatopsis sp. TaxID=37632 RepID=UPI00261B3029|nr:TetR/AcrR family transcriptional regulator [Amycolatopsis sp.]MCU1687160.1 TetR family transcriptional regulator [Amycolatopsis sp.]
MPVQSSSTPPPRRGRPPSSAKRGAILEAATEVFLREGYNGTNLDVVAKIADVSKQTVYSHFTDKETLFLSVVEAARAEAPASLMAPGRRLLSASDLRGSLVEFGEALLELVLSDRVAALRRVMIGELARMPKLRELWAAGAPAELWLRLAGEFGELAADGVVDIPDVPAAVTQLFGLLGYEGQSKSLYGVIALTSAEKRAIAESAAELFVRAYGPR